VFKDGRGRHRLADTFEFGSKIGTIHTIKAALNEVLIISALLLFPGTIDASLEFLGRIPLIGQ
jgi:hypothetical protein